MQTVHLIDSFSAENINNHSLWALDPEQDSEGSFQQVIALQVTFGDLYKDLNSGKDKVEGCLGTCSYSLKTWVKALP